MVATMVQAGKILPNSIVVMTCLCYLTQNLAGQFINDYLPGIWSAKEVSGMDVLQEVR
jgi:hypothetical protein